MLHDWASQEESSDEPVEQGELGSTAPKSRVEPAPDSAGRVARWGSATSRRESAAGDVVEADEEASEAEVVEPEPDDAEPVDADVEIDETPMHVELSHEHAAGDLHIPYGYRGARGRRRRRQAGGGRGRIAL